MVRFTNAYLLQVFLFTHVSRQAKSQRNLHQPLGSRWVGLRRCFMQHTCKCHWSGALLLKRLVNVAVVWVGQMFTSTPYVKWSIHCCERLDKIKSDSLKVHIKKYWILIRRFHSRMRMVWFSCFGKKPLSFPGKRKSNTGNPDCFFYKI